MVDHPSLGALIRRQRSRLGLTQARLAELVGKSPSTVRSWERDRNLPADQASLTALIAVLGLTEAEIESAIGEAPPADPEPIFAGSTIEDLVAEEKTSSRPAAEDAQLDIETVAEPAPTPDPKPDSGLFASDEPEPPPLRDEPSSAATEMTAVSKEPASPPLSAIRTRPRVPSYLDDPDEVNTYRVRLLLTVALMVLLLIILAWAFGEARDALGSLFGEPSG